MSQTFGISFTRICKYALDLASVHRMGDYSAVKVRVRKRSFFVCRGDFHGFELLADFPQQFISGDR